MFKRPICQQFIIDVRKSSPSTSVHFATRLRRSRVFLSQLIFTFFMQAAASKMRTRNSSHEPNFILYTSLFIQHHKQKSNLVRYEYWNGSILVTIQNSGVPGGGGLTPPRNSEDIGGVLDRMSKKNRCLDFLL